MKHNSASCAVIILAAGLGKRMHSPLPKVLHDLCGQPILGHILFRICEKIPTARVAVVVGHGGDQVENAIRNNPSFATLDLTFITQSEQRGTGHATRCAMDSPWGAEVAAAKLPVLVLPGDSPLITGELLEQMAAPLAKSDALRLLGCVVEQPFGYGRIIRRGKRGPVLRIVEERDAKPLEKTIREVAFSMYLFQPQFLTAGLRRLTDKNAQGEYYLTDLVSQAARASKKITVLQWPDPRDLTGINDSWELATAGKILNERTLRQLARGGVKFIDPTTVRVDVNVEVAAEAVLHPGVILTGKTRVARGAVIGPRAVLKDMEIGEGVTIKTGTIGEGSVISAGAVVGPYAHLRPESVVGPGAKIGNFVELKKARVGAKTSVAHLSYLGDAEVGDRVNIGCGFITCNFDGRVIDGQRKHRTIIEDDVFLGSDCQCIAPVRVGKGAYVASGSTITDDVEPDALAIARSRQVNKPGYARKLKG